MYFYQKKLFFINYANLKYLYLYKLVETFTFLSYFFMRNILSPSSNFYLYFENLSFFNKFAHLYPPKWIEFLYRMSWNFVYTLKVFWYNICANYKAIENLFFFLDRPRDHISHELKKKLHSTIYFGLGVLWSY